MALALQRNTWSYTGCTHMNTRIIPMGGDSNTRRNLAAGVIGGYRCGVTRTDQNEIHTRYASQVIRDIYYYTSGEPDTVKGRDEKVRTSRLPPRYIALPHSSAPLLGTQELRRARLLRTLVFKPEVKSFGRSRDLCSLSMCEVVLLAPRRRHAAGRERHDLPSYVLFIAHLQSSSQ